ncbi:MAG: ferritin-like domain-containing protein [bacterium]|nr:ferritin-like domain-containing protein [Candidatus Kapabacteria bacterium]
MTNEIICNRLNEILALEISGALMYLHYSYYIYGHARIPIVGWLRSQSSEGMTHATEVGDKIISFGGDPVTAGSNKFNPSFESLDDMLRQTLRLEKEAFDAYAKLLGEVESENLVLRVFLENKIAEESEHIEEIEKMLRPDVVH